MFVDTAASAESAVPVPTCRVRPMETSRTACADRQSSGGSGNRRNGAPRPRTVGMLLAVALCLVAPRLARAGGTVPPPPLGKGGLDPLARTFMDRTETAAARVVALRKTKSDYHGIAADARLELAKLLDGLRKDTQSPLSVRLCAAYCRRGLYYGTLYRRNNIEGPKHTPAEQRAFEERASAAFQDWLQENDPVVTALITGIGRSGEKEAVAPALRHKDPAVSEAAQALMAAGLVQWPPEEKEKLLLPVVSETDNWHGTFALIALVGGNKTRLGDAKARPLDAAFAKPLATIAASPTRTDTDRSRALYLLPRRFTRTELDYAVSVFGHVGDLTMSWADGSCIRLRFIEEARLAHRPDLIARMIESKGKTAGLSLDTRTAIAEACRYARRVLEGASQVDDSMGLP